MGRMSGEAGFRENDLAAAQDERRGEARQAISVLINAGLRRDEVDGLCRIRNLSDQGLMIETQLPLAVDDRLSLLLRSGRTMTGTVRWIANGRAGLHMDEAMSLPLLNEAIAPERVERRGAFPAFARRERALVAIDHRRLRCEVQEISLGHALVDGLTGLKQGDIAHISIDGLGTLLAKFRPGCGADGDMTLALFTQPLHYRLLEEWLVAHMERHATSGQALPTTAAADISAAI